VKNSRSKINSDQCTKLKWKNTEGEERSKKFAATCSLEAEYRLQYKTPGK